MKKGRHFRAEGHKKLNRKAIVAVIASVLIVCGAIGGTVAWLVTETAPVKNTFTYGDINIGLEETTGETYEMMPGNTIDKDPKITVEKGSEDSWLFVKIDESTDAKFDDFMTYEVADGWTKLETDKDGNEITDIVYYREVDAADVETDDVVFSVLKDDQVVVKDEVTKKMFNDLTEETYPTLTFTGYAVQRDADLEAIDSAAEAWALAVENSAN